MKVIITIDTEADNQWERLGDLTTANIDYLPRFQELCNRYALKTTYLCSYEVVASPQFDKVIAAYEHQGMAEVGAHLHPWSNPPYEDDPFTGTGKHAYPSELPVGIFRRKMEALTEIIHSRIGRPPRSYRAGRWGFCASHIPVLLDLGYEADCSVTPLVSWRGHPGAKEGGPDFRGAPAAPYFLDIADVCRRGDSRLLEVPVTILHTSRAMASTTLRSIFAARRKGFPCKVLNKIFKLDPQWFRPYPHMSAGRLKDVYRAARKRGLPVVEMMFHSSELMPGGSPYTPTEESVEQLYEKLESIFDYVSQAGCTGTTLTEFKDEFCREKVIGR